MTAPRTLLNSLRVAKVVDANNVDSSANKALGRKTLTLEGSTDFSVSCDGGVTARKVRVQVTTTGER
jgi:hypothetical protein